MKPWFRSLVVVAHLAALVGPVAHADTSSGSDDPTAKQDLDLRLRHVREARVSYLWRDTPGGQLLAQRQWLLVRSPRASSDGLRFTAARPESLAIGTSLPWEFVDHIQVRSNHADRGAAVGAVVFAGFGALAEYAGSQVGLAPSYDPHYLRGIAIGALIGTVVGAAIGSASRSWITVYP